jgi:hypothetical protein
MKQISEIRKEISEIRKSEKILGPIEKIVGHKAMLNYIKYEIKSDSGLYGITMTEIPKVGINPRSEYNTPIGIYFYPLDFYKETIENEYDELPFQHNAKYINLIKSKSPKPSVLSLTDVTQTEKLEIIEKIKSLEVFSKDKTVINSDIENIISDSHYYSLVKTPGGKLWYILMRVAQYLSNHSKKYFGTNSNSRVIWNWLLRRLNYKAVIDLGGGIIHNNEPTQGLFLSIEDVNLVKSINNIIDKVKGKYNKLLAVIFSKNTSDEELINLIKTNYQFGFENRTYLNKSFYNKVIEAINLRSKAVKSAFIAKFNHSIIDIVGLSEDDYSKIIINTKDFYNFTKSYKKIPTSSWLSVTKRELIFLRALFNEDVKWNYEREDLLTDAVVKKFTLSTNFYELVDNMND